MTDTYYKEEDLQMVSETETAPVAPNACFLAKWLTRLLIVSVVLAVANFFSGDNMEESASAVYTFFTLLGGACSVIYALILLKLSDVEALYRKSAYYWLGCALLAVGSIVAIIIGELMGGFGLVLGGIIMIVATVIGLLGEYYEYQAHANVVAPYDAVFSAKWKTLWKYYLGMTLGVLVATVLLMLIPLLGLIAIVVLAIGTLVVSILKLVYLYRMKKLFEAMCV